MADVPTLGSRGEGWVVLQFVLMGAIAVAAIVGPRWPGAVSAPLAVVGVAVAVGGATIALVAARLLGRGLTPLPHPSEGSELVAHGPYRVVRHPIYAGGALFFAGASLVLSPAALALTAALIVVWALKVSVEERFLRATYPEYGGYCEAVRWRLVPFVY